MCTILQTIQHTHTHIHPSLHTNTAISISGVYSVSLSSVGILQVVLSDSGLMHTLGSVPLQWFWACLAQKCSSLSRMLSSGKIKTVLVSREHNY